MVKATKSGSFKAVKLPDPQVTVATCYSLIDIGTVPNIYKGQLQGMVHRIFITWELPKLMGIFNEEKGEQPFVVSEEFTLSTKNNSNFAKLISAWRNKPLTPEEEVEFDPSVLLGKSGLVQLAHRRKASYKTHTIQPDQVTNENTALVMQSIMKRPNDVPQPEQINPTLYWDWEAIEKGEKQFDKEMFDLIPQFIQKKIMESDEFKKFGAQHFSAEATGTPEAATSPEPQQATGPSGPVTDDDW